MYLPCRLHHLYHSLLRTENLIFKKDHHGPNVIMIEGNLMNRIRIQDLSNGVRMVFGVRMIIDMILVKGETDLTRMITI